MRKEELTELVAAAREKEEADLVPLVDDAEPERPGRWTAKDNLAHLSAWRDVAAAEMDAARTAGTPPKVADEDDVENAGIYERTHHLAAAEVKAQAAHSWDRLTASLEACTDADLQKPRPRRAPQKTWQVIPGNTYYHLAQHLVYLNTERGDEAAAEDAAKWGYELHMSKAADDEQRGTAAYNLGCFYALRGQAGVALPLLRIGIELNPPLREWARSDTDLDPIRSQPEVVSLLAGR